VPIEFHKIRGQAELFPVFDALAAEAESGDSPIVHFECHGLSDRSGLSLADPTTVAWMDLTPSLVRINVPARCNLLFSVAVCYGAHGVASMEQTARAPFWAIRAPREEITPRELYGPYLRLYSELLSSGDGDRALSTMVEPASVRSLYGFLTCEQCFMQAFQLHLTRSTTEVGYRGDVERIRSYFAALGREVDKSLVRRVLEGIEEPLFNDLFRSFVMADIYPENAQRFPLRFADVAPPRVLEASREQ